jgi:excisionase family DNA binding protein
MKNTSPGGTPAYRKVAEAARLLSVAPATVYALVAAGDLEAVRVGRSLRISAAAIEAYLDRRSTLGRNPAPGGGGGAMLTLADVARKLNVGKRTVEKIVASGELDSVKVASVRRVRPEALDEYILAASTASAR